MQSHFIYTCDWPLVPSVSWASQLLMFCSRTVCNRGAIVLLGESSNPVLFLSSDTGVRSSLFVEARGQMTNNSQD